MRNFINSERSMAAVVLAAALTLAGSSSMAASRVVPGAASHGRFDARSCSGTVIYAVSGNNRSVVAYNTDGNTLSGPCGHITGLASPQGLAVDAQGNVWVTDAVMHQVLAFAPGKQSAIMTLTDAHGIPVGVAVDPANGTVYVTDYSNDSDSSIVVEVYANGSTTPTGALRDTNNRNASNVAVDNKGNVYASFMTPANTAQVDRWMGGTGSPQNLGLKLISSGPIVTTKSGALAVCDPFGFKCGEFASGSQDMTNIFAPRLGGLGPDKGWGFHPSGLALDQTERRAFVASQSVSMWKYPGPEHKPLDLVRFHGPYEQGLAVSPASAPGNPY